MSRRLGETLHVGADLDVEFVKTFREYVSREETKYSQTLLIKRLIEWWMQQRSMVQDHIYRGRFDLIKIADVPLAPESADAHQVRVTSALEDIRDLLLRGARQEAPPPAKRPQTGKKRS